VEPHPWLRPLWRRVGLIVFCAAWVGFEAWLEPGSFWFWMFLVIAAWGAWDLLLSGKYPASDRAKTP
jgi:hypothetical protein